MTDFHSLLPTNRKPAMVAIEGASSGRIGTIPAPIEDMDDPLKVVLGAVPFLAWARTVGVWDDDWPDWKKRRAAERAIYLRQRGGTLTALKGWIDLLGAEVVDAILPPGGCFATRGQTREQRLAFLSRFAELRITFRRAPGPGDAGAFYASPFRPGEAPSFAGFDFAVPGTARQRYGRRATIVDGGVETEVLWALAGKIETEGEAIAVERITVPGRARASEPFVGAIIAGGGRSFAEPFETTSRILTLGPDRAPQVSPRSSLVERPANPLEVLAVTPERVSERAVTAERPMMVGGFPGDFAYMNTASNRYYDRFRLFDAERSPTRQTASYGTFAGHSWSQITPFTAELRVHFPGGAPATDARVGGIVGMYPAPSSGRLAKIANAVRAGKSARDKVFFTAQTMRLRTLQDGIPLDGSYRLGGLLNIARGSL